MFPALSRIARASAALVALLAVMSLVAMSVHLHAVRYDSWAETALEMARFFTILTVLLVAISFALAATLWDGVYPPWLAALTLSMVLVGSVYHLLLSDLVTFTGLGFWADHGLHTGLPLACLLWWLTHAPKRGLIYVDLPIFALWPSVYMAYALWRGGRDGVYPYPFMDLTTLSGVSVATNLAILLLVLLLGGMIMILIGRYADR